MHAERFPWRLGARLLVDGPDGDAGDGDAHGRAAQELQQRLQAAQRARLHTDALACAAQQPGRTPQRSPFIHETTDEANFDHGDGRLAVPQEERVEPCFTGRDGLQSLPAKHLSHQRTHTAAVLIITAQNLPAHSPGVQQYGNTNVLSHRLQGKQPRSLHAPWRGMQRAHQSGHA